MKNINGKIILFEKLKNKGIFWSYSKNITYDKAGDNLFIEYVLKYGDFEDIKSIFNLFGENKIKKIWKLSLVSDERFKKLNLFLARVFFSMDVEANYFEGIMNGRLEKLKTLAS